MCTVSWAGREPEEGYVLWFNRDELKTRKTALLPRIREREGVRWIAPKDGDQGGTWIAVNHWGVTTCLLNHYPEGMPIVTPGSEGYESRGRIVWELCTLAPEVGIGSALRKRKLTDYRPFRLLRIGFDCSTEVHVWDGKELLQAASVEPPLTGSSYRSQEIAARRMEGYRALMARGRGLGKETETLLAEYHRQRDPTDGAASVNMERPDARTVNQMRIDVGRKSIAVDYSEKMDDGIFFTETPRLEMIREERITD
jgi:hypothetical protein